MGGFDIFLLVILGAGAITGFQRGFIQSFAGFVGIGLAIWAGLNFSTLLENFVDQQQAIPDSLVNVVSLLATIGLVYLGVKVVSKVIHTTVHSIGLGVFNRLAGSIFSLLLTSMVLCTVLYYVGPFLGAGEENSFTAQSKIYPHLMKMAEFMKTILVSPTTKNIEELNN